jgi:REP element-mobilizing transposase RayT
VHVVFATRNRRKCIPRDADDWLHQRLREEASARRAQLLCVGNADDHVHMLIELTPTVCLADLVRRMKSASSRAWNGARSTRMYWQTGYWARSVAVESAAPLMDYVTEQRDRHRRGALLAAFEQPESSTE